MGRIVAVQPLIPEGHDDLYLDLTDAKIEPRERRPRWKIDRDFLDDVLRSLGHEDPVHARFSEHSAQQKVDRLAFVEAAKMSFNVQDDADRRVQAQARIWHRRFLETQVLDGQVVDFLVAVRKEGDEYVRQQQELLRELARSASRTTGVTISEMVDSSKR